MKKNKKKGESDMRKFDIPNRKSKKAFPRATYLGESVLVRGVVRKDNAQRLYYSVRKVGTREEPRAVRCDKLTVM